MRQFIESLEGRTLFAITLPDAPTVYALTETTLSVPRTPTLNAVSSTSELATTLAWSNVIGETGYEIQRARNGGGFYFLVRTAKNATSYTDKEKLLYDTSYSYQVKAIADGPDSLWSNSASVRTIKNPVIQTITDLRGTYNTATGKVDLLYTFDPTANPYVVLKDGAVVKNADGSNYTDMNGDAHVAQAQGTNATYQVRDAQGDVSNVIEIKLGAVPNEPPPDPDPIPDPDPTPDPVPVEGAHRTTDPVIAPTITRTVVLKDSDSITVARSAIAVAGTKVTLAPFKVYELGSPLAMGNDTELDLNGATLKVKIGRAHV